MLNQPGNGKALRARRDAARDLRAAGSPAGSQPDEAYILKKYNEVLMRKLEQKMAEVEGAFNRLKIAHQEIRAAESRFRALVENGFEAVSMLAADGTVLYRSASAPRIFGHSMEELAGLGAFDLVHPEDLPAARRWFASLLAAPSGVGHGVLRFRHKDGGWRSLEAHGVNMLARPEIRAIVVDHRDVTGRTLQEQKTDKLPRIRAGSRPASGKARLPPRKPPAAKTGRRRSRT